MPRPYNQARRKDGRPAEYRCRPILSDACRKSRPVKNRYRQKAERSGFRWSCRLRHRSGSVHRYIRKNRGKMHASDPVFRFPASKTSLRKETADSKDKSPCNGLGNGENTIFYRKNKGRHSHFRQDAQAVKPAIPGDATASGRDMQQIDSAFSECGTAPENENRLRFYPASATRIPISLSSLASIVSRVLTASSSV